jgi:hypothetical protein
MTFEEDGLGSIVVEGMGLCFVTRKGRTAPAFEFDNGTDPAVEGLVRTVKDGKIGFLSTRLDPIVPAIWDFAFPFEHGVSVVCVGCTSTPVQPGSEHRIMTGGKWGYIDKRGRVVVPVAYDRQSLPPAEVAGRLAAR